MDDTSGAQYQIEEIIDRGPSDSLMHKSFEEKFLIDIDKASDEKKPILYIKNAPLAISLHYSLVKRLTQIHRKITVNKVEANIEFVLVKEEAPVPAFRFDLSSGEIYDKSINSIGVQEKKIIIYGLHDNSFPTPQEIAFIEQSNHELFFRVLPNGYVIMYGKISQTFKDFIAKRKEKVIKDYGGEAWIPDSHGNFMWHKDLPAVDLSANGGELEAGLWTISTTIGAPIYISKTNLEEQYRKYNNIFEHTSMSIEEWTKFNPNLYNTLDMYKIDKKGFSIFGIEVV